MDTQWLARQSTQVNHWSLLYQYNRDQWGQLNNLPLTSLCEGATLQWRHCAEDLFENKVMIGDLHNVGSYIFVTVHRGYGGVHDIGIKQSVNYFLYYSV